MAQLKKSSALLVVHYTCIVVSNRKSYKYLQESVKQIYTQKQYTYIEKGWDLVSTFCMNRLFRLKDGFNCIDFSFC